MPTDAHDGPLLQTEAPEDQLMPTEAQDDPLLQTILTRTPANGGDQSLLPLLTTRGEPLIEHAVRIVSGWVTEQCPSTNPADVQMMAESVVRLAQSHLLTPTKTPAEAARDLALVACRCLRLPDPH